MTHRSQAADRHCLEYEAVLAALEAASRTTPPRALPRFVTLFGSLYFGAAALALLGFIVVGVR